LAISVPNHHRQSFHIVFAAPENNHYENAKKPGVGKTIRNFHQLDHELLFTKVVLISKNLQLLASNLCPTQSTQRH
jgi:hypothetical protein